VVDGAVGIAYFEVTNLLGTPEVVTQTAIVDTLFWRPTKKTIMSLSRYATVFEVVPGVLNVFLPSTSQVIERQLIGAAHLHTLVTESDFLGPYIYDPTAAGVLTELSTTTTTLIEAGQPYRALGTVNSLAFTDATGYLMFDFGTADQEGPVRYVGRSGDKLLLLDPAYVFQLTHAVGADVTMLSKRAPIVLSGLGTEYPAYLTAIAPGRLYCQDLIDQLVATGLTVIVTVLYPGDVGLGNAGMPVVGSKVSDIVDIFGGDP
jgi:hypothetical protein